MTRLLPLSLLLLLTTLFSSFLPLYLSLSLSPLRLKLLGLVGKGVLVGAALGVVVPEGVEGVYASSDEAHVGQGGWIGMALVAGFTTM
jgi:zinc transporter 9